MLPLVFLILNSCLRILTKLKGENNQIPKLPNFRRIAARIIDPKTLLILPGAS
jgi:hypothetical protein